MACQLVVHFAGRCGEEATLLALAAERLMLPVSDILAGYVAKALAEREALVVDEKTGRQYKDHEFPTQPPTCGKPLSFRDTFGSPTRAGPASMSSPSWGRPTTSSFRCPGTKRQTLSVYSLTEYRKAFGLEVMQRRWSLPQIMNVS